MHGLTAGRELGTLATEPAEARRVLATEVIPNYVLHSSDDHAGNLYRYSLRTVALRIVLSFQLANDRGLIEKMEALMRAICGLLIIVIYPLYADFMIGKYALYAASPYGIKSLVLWWANFVGITGGSAVVAYHLLRPRR